MDGYIQQQSQLDRRRKLLQALQAQALAPTQSQTVGDRVVPYSPIQGLSQLAQAYLAKKGLSGVNEKEAQLVQQRQGQTKEATQRVIDMMMGKPQTGGPLQNPPGGEYQPVTPAVAPNLPGAAITAATEPALAENKGLQGITQAMLKNKFSNAGGTPYYQFLPTAEGYAVGNARTGEINRPGDSVVRSQDDPTLQAELAGAKKSAVLEAESKAADEARYRGLPEMTKMARTILESGKPTQSGVGSMYDYLGSVFGFTPEGATQADQLRAIGGALVSKMPRMEGPQSDRDTMLYREMAGQIGDSNIPIARRLAALQVVENMWAKPPGTPYDEYAKAHPISEVSNATDETDMQGVLDQANQLKNAYGGGQKVIEVDW